MSTQAFARKTDPSTSWDAARSVKNLGRTRETILHILRFRGAMTDEQIAKDFEDNWFWIGKAQGSPSGLRSRRAELVRMGKVEACGTGKTASGRNCTLWRAIPEKGQMELL